MEKLNKGCLLTCGPTQYFLGYQFETNEMRLECNFIGERRGVYGDSGGNPSERNHLGDKGWDGRIILRWIFRKWDVGYGLDRTEYW
jgi:hypothetical protein